MSRHGPAIRHDDHGALHVARGIGARAVEAHTLGAQLGFEALATTSAGYAFSRGVPDNCVPREALMVHLAEIAAATEGLDGTLWA